MRLLDAGEDQVLLAVCQPDRPRGRGKKIEPPPVKRAAATRGIEVVQPVKLKDGDLASRMRGLDLDLAIVVAYGRILPEDVFKAPRHETWNVHASLLPRHRGASPVAHAILAGDRETGVTLMKLTAGLDEGPMLLRRAIPLRGDETGGALTGALAAIGAELLVEGLQRAKEEGLAAIPQDPLLATYAPLLEKAHGRLDFSEPAGGLERRVRAFHPWPGAFVEDRRGEPIRILRARVLSNRPSAGARPGEIVELGDHIAIATPEGALAILELQVAGKRPVSASDYLRGAGRGLRAGAVFAAG